MTKVRSKRKNNMVETKRSTLDQKHTEKIEVFEKMNRTLPKKKNKLIRLQDELSDLMNMDPNKYTDENICRKSQLMDNIEKLRTEILSVENCSESLNYISKTLPILIDYYDNDTIADRLEEEYINEINDCGKKNILSYFAKESINNNCTNDTTNHVPNKKKSSQNKKHIEWEEKITRTKIKIIKHLQHEIDYLQGIIEEHQC